jgi:hypothetical protein
MPTDTPMQLAAVTGLCGPGRGTAQSLSWAAWTLGWRNRWGSFFVAALLLWRRPLMRRGARRSRGAGVRQSSVSLLQVAGHTYTENGLCTEPVRTECDGDLLALHAATVTTATWLVAGDAL